MSVPTGVTRATILAFSILLSACAGGTGPGASTSGPAATAQAAASTAAASAKPAGAAPSTTKPLELVGKFALSPAHGPLGTPVTAMGSGLKPQTRYDVVWTSVEGSWKLNEDRTAYLGRTFKPAQLPMKSVTTDAVGAFTTSFTVPLQDFGFQHDVLVMDDTKTIRNKAGFDVDLQVSISPTSGPVGTPITIEAKGVGWRDFQGAWMAAYDNHFTGLLSGVTTKGLVRAVIPATGGVGTHVITILSGDLNFMYLNMQQSPEPDRPQFRIPFTVTEGTAVMPPPVDQQRVAIPPSKTSASGLSVSPAAGIVGSQATLTAKALPANSDITLTYLAQVGNRVTTAAYSEQGKPLGKVRTDGTGSFSWTFPLPDDLGGVHKVLARIGDKTVGETEFTVQPNAFPLSRDRGPAGTEVKIHLKGVGWTETANFYSLNYDNGYMGYACGFNSSGDVEVTLAMSGVKGWHYIDLYPGLYKGQETRPLNFRIPQLSYAADHPGEDLPAFHFAFYVE